MPNPPYRECRLVNGEKPLTTQWYLMWWTWDAQKGLLVRKRDYKINQLKTKGERNAYAKKHIKIINGFLEEGYHINTKVKTKVDVSAYVMQNKDFTIIQAFDYIMPLVKSKVRPASFNAFASVKEMFVDFCKHAGWDTWKVRTLKQNDIVAWLDYTVVSRGIGNLTRNNYLGFLSAIFTMLKDRNALDINPCAGIKQLKVDESPGNIAYTPEQVIKLKEAITADQPRLWLYVTFMFYGFIRPAEIGRLRVGMIKLSDNYIHLPGTITKNRFSRSVRISPAFKNYLSQMNLEMYRPDDYVFGANLVTGPMKLQKNLPTALHLATVRDLAFGDLYTLYSWKHTGVVIHYRAGVDIKTLQAQLGHQSLHETDVYLKSLHLYENTEIQDKSPAI